MACELQFICPLPNGIHARPASALEAVARQFCCNITLCNERSGRLADAKSVLAVVAAEIHHLDSCRVQADGPDAKAACAALDEFLRIRLPHCDDALPQETAGTARAPLPRGLRQAGATILAGLPLVPGIGCGRVFAIAGWQVPAAVRAEVAAEPGLELDKVEHALSQLAEGYERRLPAASSRLEADLLRAHLSVARDPGLVVWLHEAVLVRRRTATGAIADAEEHFSAMLRGASSQLVRERALDVRDVCTQLLRLVGGDGTTLSANRLQADSIVMAPALAPEQFLALDRSFLKGLVLGEAGTTSHTIILARSFGIPALTDVQDLNSAQLEGEEVVVDGNLGVLVTVLTPAAKRYYAMEERRVAGRAARYHRFGSQPAATADQHRVQLGANVATAAEARAAFSLGAEGIGLFRSEMLFCERANPPGEDEQFEEYRQTLAAAGARPVIVRTLDIGGDKPLAWLRLPVEPNPFLGVRAVRLYPELESLFRTQLRALLRASLHGRLQVMVPMLTTLDEVRWVKRVLGEERARCVAQGIDCGCGVPLGAMIEVPAAAFQLEAFSRELDFFSIGSNDLLQSFAAADRSNPRVAKLYDPLQPAFLRLLQKVVNDARAAGRWVGLCGEMAGQTRCVALLVGLGLDELSVAPSLLAGTKAELAGWSLPACRELAEAALGCATGAEVVELLRARALQRPLPLLGTELVLLDSESASQEEVLKELADHLYVLGRTEQAAVVEEALWQRETNYSTGFGFGLAIPHCSTAAVTADSLLVLRLRTPVAWNAADGQPVRTVLLLALRDSDQAAEHGKVLARLARKLMQEEFRARLETAQDANAICALLKDSVGA